MFVTFFTLTFFVTVKNLCSYAVVLFVVSQMFVLSIKHLKKIIFTNIYPTINEN